MVYLFEVTRVVCDSSVDGYDIKVGDVIVVYDGYIAVLGVEDMSVIEDVFGGFDIESELIIVYSGAGVDEFVV